MTPYEARTAYNVAIPRAFKNRQHAVSWAESKTEVFPGLKVIALTKRGPRQVWKHEEVAA